MRSIIIFAIGILVVYSFLQDKNSVINNFVKTPEDLKKTDLQGPATQEKDTLAQDYSTNPLLTKNIETVKEKKYEYQPQNAMERIVTNVVSDFIKTDAGAEVAKTLIGQGDSRRMGNNYAFSTKGFNPYIDKYKIESVTKTDGVKTLCGQRIKLNYLINNAAGKEVERDIIEFEVGKHDVEEFNILAEGLPKQEMIKASFLSKAAVSKILKDDPNNKVTLSVIEHLTEKNFDDKKVKIFDDYITTSRPIMCGDKVEFEYRIYEITGKIISEEKFSFITGDFKYPQIMTHSVINMPLLSTRTIIMPRKYLAASENPILKGSENNEEFIFMEISKPYIFPKEEVQKQSR